MWRLVRSRQDKNNERHIAVRGRGKDFQQELPPWGAGQPLTTIATATYVEQSRAAWHPARAEELLSWPQPGFVGGPRVDLRERLPRRLPALGVLEVRNASVHGATGWIMAPPGVVLRDQTWFGPTFDTEAPPVLKVARTIALRGVTLTLMSDWARSNYAHFMCDALPRLDLFNQAGLSFDNVDQVLCSSPERQRQQLTRLGIPPAKIVHAAPDSAYLTEVLLSPSFPGVRRTLPSWGVDFLRNRLSQRPQGAHRRLYVKRNTSRLVANEADLEPALLAHGFELVDAGAAGFESRAAFAAADIVVGAHGAALADIVFCPSHARVFELVPTDHVFPYYYAIAVASGLNYRYMTGHSHEVRAPGALGPSTHNFLINPAVFAEGLADLVRELEYDDDHRGDTI